MIYLLDTVALVRHFSGLGRIGQKAANVLDNLEVGSDLLLISVVSLMEVLYLSEKNRIPIDLAETLERLQASECYAVVDLNAKILRIAGAIEFRELHDRLISQPPSGLGSRFSRVIESSSRSRGSKLSGIDRGRA